MEQVLIYQGEEMEEDEETMADYDIQVRHFLQQSPASSVLSALRSR